MVLDSNSPADVKLATLEDIREALGELRYPHVPALEFHDAVATGIVDSAGTALFSTEAPAAGRLWSVRYYCLSSTAFPSAFGAVAEVHIAASSTVLGASTAIETNSLLPVPMLPLSSTWARKELALKGSAGQRLWFRLSAVVAGTQIVAHVGYEESAESDSGRELI